MRNHPPLPLRCSLLPPQGKWLSYKTFSILRIWGLHVHIPSVIFKLLGPGLELHSALWESSALAITSPAGPRDGIVYSFSLPF